MSVPNSALFASTTKTWTAVDTYTTNQYVIFNQNIYQCSANVGPSASNPSVDTGHWTLVDPLFPSQTLSSDTFKTLREDLNYGQLAQLNEEYRLSQAETDILNILSNSLSGYTGSRSNLLNLLNSFQTQINSINSYGYARPEYAWATAINYKVGDVVTAGFWNSIYVCLSDHTSGVFATDLAATKWKLFIDMTGTIKKFQIATATGVGLTLNTVKGDCWFLDSAAGIINVNLPVAPALGDPPIYLTHIGGDVTVPASYITIKYNGTDLLMGGTSDIQIDMNNAAFCVAYSDSTHGWRFSTL